MLAYFVTQVINASGKLQPRHALLTARELVVYLVWIYVLYIYFEVYIICFRDIALLLLLRQVQGPEKKKLH